MSSYSKYNIKHNKHKCKLSWFYCILNFSKISVFTKTCQKMCQAMQISPNQNLLLSILHQNKVLHDSQKKERGPKAEYYFFLD